MTYPTLLGAIIAGGASSRFGSDKALALLGGQPLIAHAQAALEPLVGAIVVCGRAWGGLPMLADVPVAGLGPLGGIAAALGHARAQGFDHVLTIGCDMPGVPDAAARHPDRRRAGLLRGCADPRLLAGCGGGWARGPAGRIHNRREGRRAVDPPLGRVDRGDGGAPHPALYATSTTTADLPA